MNLLKSLTSACQHTIDNLNWKSPESKFWCWCRPSWPNRLNLTIDKKGSWIRTIVIRNAQTNWINLLNKAQRTLVIHRNRWFHVHRTNFISWQSVKKLWTRQQGAFIEYIGWCQSISTENQEKLIFTTYIDSVRTAHTQTYNWNKLFIVNCKLLLISSEA